MWTYWTNSKAHLIGWPRTPPWPSSNSLPLPWYCGQVRSGRFSNGVDTCATCWEMLGYACALKDADSTALESYLLLCLASLEDKPRLQSFRIRAHANIVCRSKIKEYTTYPVHLWRRNEPILKKQSMSSHPKLHGHAQSKYLPRHKAHVRGMTIHYIQIMIYV